MLDRIILFFDLFIFSLSEIFEIYQETETDKIFYIIDSFNQIETNIKNKIIFDLEIDFEENKIKHKIY